MRHSLQAVFLIFAGSPTQVHSLVDASKGLFQCGTCKRTFQSTGNLQRHIDCHHRLSGPIKCRYCSFRCHENRQMELHMNVTHRFFCKICNKTFASFTGYSTHERVHHSQSSNLWECSICGKKFSCQSRLQIHERQHSDTRSFQCLVCKKSYKHKKNLDNHPCNS